MKITQKRLGSTDLNVSLIGLGTVKFGRNTEVKYPHSFVLPSDQEIANLLSLAQDLQINLLDTAPAYGDSEQRLGKMLHKQRHDWVLVSKAGEDFVNGQSVYNFSRKSIIASIERSLQRLKTDYIDVLLIHSDGNDEQIITENDVFATLQYAKQQGLIRYYGMSTKTLAGGMYTVENADVAMVTCNTAYQDDLPIIARAAQLNKGILIKKALASGHIEKLSDKNPIQASMNFIFKQQGVSSIILGTINQAHLKENVQSAVAALKDLANL
jgi:aryl-alcohol dehydrogenase-like predicted oxidoreductase